MGNISLNFLGCEILNNCLAEDMAAKRLNSNSPKLLKTNQFQSYAVLTELEKRGIIEDSIKGLGHYLPSCEPLYYSFFILDSGRYYHCFS